MLQSSEPLTPPREPSRLNRPAPSNQTGRSSPQPSRQRRPVSAAFLVNQRGRNWVHHQLSILGGRSQRPAENRTKVASHSPIMPTSIRFRPISDARVYTRSIRCHSDSVGLESGGRGIALRHDGPWHRTGPGFGCESPSGISACRGTRISRSLSQKLSVPAGLTAIAENLPPPI